MAFAAARHMSKASKTRDFFPNAAIHTQKLMIHDNFIAFLQQLSNTSSGEAVFSSCDANLQTCNQLGELLMKYRAFAALLFAALVFASCQSSDVANAVAPVETYDAAIFLSGYKEIEDVLTESIVALEDKDVDRYMAAYHITDVPEYGYSSEEVYEYIEQSALETFAFFDLSYQIEDMELVSIDDDESRVTVSATLRTSSNVESVFEDSTNTSELELVKVDGVWYISSSSLFR